MNGIGVASFDCPCTLFYLKYIVFGVVLFFRLFVSLRSFLIPSFLFSFFLIRLGVLGLLRPASWLVWYLLLMLLFVLSYIFVFCLLLLSPVNSGHN